MARICDIHKIGGAPEWARLFLGNHLPREILGATKQFLKPTQSDCSWKCNKSHDHVGKLSISPARALLQFAGALIKESVGILMGQVTTDPKKIGPA